MIFILDDEDMLKDLIEKAFPDEKIKVFRKSKKLLEYLETSKPDIIVLDNRIKRAEDASEWDYLSSNNENEGIYCFIEIKKRFPSIPVFIATRYLTHEIYNYSRFYIEIDPDRKDEMIQLIRERLTPYLDSGKIQETRDNFREYGFITNDRKLINELIKLRKIIPSDAPVLIVGETGVGKDLLSKIIHKMSPRSNYPFKVFSLSTHKGEASKVSLLGYVKGAFTGAYTDKKGILEETGDGTLVINQIESASLEFQEILLEITEDREFRRLGDTRRRKFNGRFIFITNKNLDEMVKKGEFRRDLYFRLRNNVINLPPLRERRGDIFELIEYFKEGHQIEFSKKAEWFLRKEYIFPGNVRELKNLIESFKVQNIKYVDLGYLMGSLSSIYSPSEREKNTSPRMNFFRN